MRIGLGFHLFLLLVGTIVLGLAWRILSDDYRQWNNATLARDLTAAQGDLLRLVERLGLERGAHNEALLREEAVDPDSDALRRARDETDATIAAALAHAQAIERGVIDLAAIDHVRESLRDWRQRTALALGRTRADRPAEMIQGYIPAMVDLVTGIRPVLNSIDTAIGLADGAVATPVSIARLAADMRAEGSVRGTTMVNVVASGAPIPTPTLLRLAELDGRIDAIWARIDTLLGMTAATPAMSQAVAATVAAYQVELPKLHGLVRTASATGAAYPFAVAEFRAQQTPLHATVSQLRDAAIDAALAIAERAREARQRDLWLAASASIAALLLLAVGAGLFLTRVVNPLGAITATLTRVVKGEPASIDFTARQDDIGDVARALVEFQRYVEERGRRQSEQEMHQFLETIIDAMPVAISVKDSGLRYRYVNRYRRQLITDNEADPVGRTLSELVRPDLAALVEEADRQILASGESQHLEQVWPDRDGKPRVIWSLKAPFKDADGIAHGIITCGVDITRLKEVEAELIAQRETAESANRGKTNFLANMSHELRTPLNAIIGFAEMLAGGYLGKLSNHQQDYVGHVLQSGQHLLHVVNDLLDLSRLETGQIDLRIVPTSFDQIAVAALGLVRPQAEKAGVHLTFAPNGLKLLADERALTQILTNLLGNAIKFNRPGGEVRLRAEMHKDRVRITVTDSGIGMSPLACENASQALIPTDAHHARPNGGAGLGLAICRRLLDRLNGTLEIESELGAGTTVTVTLPAERRLPAPRSLAEAPLRV
nr:PAS domain-containing sensor histidine kinase [uncultured Dongia sp.]